MANWSDLKAAVAKVIKTNGNQQITGAVLQNVLNNIISNVGENATFAGIATPVTNPGTPDGNNRRDDWGPMAAAIVVDVAIAADVAVASNV